MKNHYAYDCNVYVADYKEDADAIGNVPVFENDVKTKNAVISVGYPFSETHFKEIKWKNDTKYIAEEICKFVQEIYESGEFGYTNHDVTDLWLEVVRVVKRQREVHIEAYIGS